MSSPVPSSDTHTILDYSNRNDGSFSIYVSDYDAGTPYYSCPNALDGSNGVEGLVGVPGGEVEWVEMQMLVAMDVVDMQVATEKALSVCVTMYNDGNQEKGERHVK